MRVWAAAFILSCSMWQGAVAKTPCHARSFEEASFKVCFYDPRTDKIQIAWRRRDGSQLQSFLGLKSILGAAASETHFAVNAGMFHHGGEPVGLFVKNGQEERGLNRNAGPGNFHMLPNGVFWVGRDGQAHITTSDTYAATRPQAQLATQSGPMLLIAGRLHPKFQDDGPSRLIRNGVGAIADGSAAFVISETPVSFGKMARFFRDALNARDALYLDGSVSSLWEPNANRMDLNAALGPMIWVY